MKPKRSLAIALLLVGCQTQDPPQDGNAVACQPDASEVRAFVLECVKNGNPHSDEEPEGLVRACRDATVEMFCGLGCYRSIRGTIYCTESKYEEAPK